MEGERGIVELRTKVERGGFHLSKDGAFSNETETSLENGPPSSVLSQPNLFQLPDVACLNVDLSKNNKLFPTSYAIWANSMTQSRKAASSSSAVGICPQRDSLFSFRGRRAAAT